MKKIVFCTFALILVLNVVIADDNKKDSIPLIIITNEVFLSIIDSFIEFEKKYGCYHPRSIYKLNVHVQSDSELHFNLYNEGIKKFEISPVEKKCFVKHGNMFFVTFDQLPDGWFNHTSKHQIVEIWDKTKRTYYIKIPIYSAWRFSYKNGSFYINEKRKCKDRPYEMKSN